MLINKIASITAFMVFVSISTDAFGQLMEQLPTPPSFLSEDVPLDELAYPPSRTFVPASNEPQVPNVYCQSCPGNSCQNCAVNNSPENACLCADSDSKAWTLQYTLGYEAFRGVSDGSWENNGIVTGLNFGTSLGSFSDVTGIGLQIGGIFGDYDWSGTSNRLRDNNQSETQGFFTAGFFRKARENSPVSAAVVYDLMLNNNFSTYSQSPTLSQWRGQVGYEWDSCNEYGLWGTLRDRSANWDVGGTEPTTWRSINEASLFWHHKWSRYSADTTLWMGLPEQDRLAGGGSLGDYLVGAQAQVPLNGNFSLVSRVTYMHPSASPGPAAATEEAWSFYVGMTFFPRGDSRTATVANEGWSPLLPVCDNGTFLVDASRTN